MRAYSASRPSAKCKLRPGLGHSRGKIWPERPRKAWRPNQRANPSLCLCQMGHLSCLSPASFNRKIKVTRFGEISKSWEKMLPWSHLGLFLGLICGAQIDANCYRGRVLSFSSSLFLIQASAGKVMEIKHRQSHSLPSAFLLPWHRLQHSN